MERIRNMLSNKNDKMVEQSEFELQGVIKQLNNIIREIRGYIKQLKMPITNQSNLKKEIERLMEEMNISQQLQLELQYNFIGDDPPLSQTVQIYYIIKESLSNILRHADATKATVIIQGSLDELLIEIADNGIGMDDVNDYINKEESNFLKQGIKNMKYRAQSIGGILTISSSKESGTKISLHVKNGVRHENGEEN